MADAKVSELTAASSAAASDLLYIVDGTDSKKITVENIFGSISTPALFKDSVIGISIPLAIIPTSINSYAS